MRGVLRPARPPVLSLLAFISIAAIPVGAQSPPNRSLGVLVVAHGATPEWNAPVKAAVDRVRATMPAEAAFLMGAPDPEQTAQQAYDKLVAAGAHRIIVVPLLISSHSAHAEQVRFIGGQRSDYPHAEHMHLTQVRGVAPVVAVTTALDDHPILAAILTDRARALGHDPTAESLVLVAHGPNEDDEAAVWTATIERLGSQIRSALPFKDIDVRLLRDDAPKPVKDRALAELRASVADRARQRRVIVVPVLLAPGRVADQIPEALNGLDFVWDGRTVLPDERIAEWIVTRAREVDATSIAGQAIPRYDERIIVTAARTVRRSRVSGRADQPPRLRRPATRS